MKKILILVASFFIMQQVNGQQIHQLSQYMLNNYAFNPAVAGSSPNFESKFGFRKQWAGIDGAPSTALLSIHGNLRENRSIGLGAMFYTDATGPTKRTGFNVTYAYHLPLEEDVTYLGFGITASIMQYRLNFSELNPFDISDPTLAAADASKGGFDSNFGIYLSNPRYWVGLAINQLFAKKFEFAGVRNLGEIQNNRHFYLTGGYRFDVNEKFGLEPGALLKIVGGASPQFELNARAIYDKQYWLGLALRTQDAFSILLGADLTNGLNFAYSYDITTSNLNRVSNGAHEITLGFNFNIFGQGNNGGISPRIIEY